MAPGTPPLRIAALCLAATGLALGADPLPADIAAMHSEGKWKIRKADLYHYLVKYESGQGNALAVLPEYMKLRLVEAEAKNRKIAVTEQDIEQLFTRLEEKLKAAGQPGGLDGIAKFFGARKEEVRRKAHQWVLMERVARAILKEKDPSRKDEPVADDSVIFVIDTLYKDAKRQTEGLPDGVIARINGIDISEYEYGRALSVELPASDVVRSLQGLILGEEVALLVGDRNPPAAEDVAEQRRWFLDLQKRQIRENMPKAPEEITDEMVEQVLQGRGTPLKLVLGNPAFLAQCRALGHFKRALTDEEVRRYYDEHKGRYGDQLKVARIVLGARGQSVHGVGKPIRTPEQGRKDSEEIYAQIKSGKDFGEIAEQRSEDADVIRKSGGVLPFWITAGMAGYEDQFKQADQLEKDGVSKPFFSAGRGYMIVKLVDRKRAPSFEQAKEGVRRDAARDRYTLWRSERTRTARVNDGLFEE